MHTFQKKSAEKEKNKMSLTLSSRIYVGQLNSIIDKVIIQYLAFLSSNDPDVNQIETTCYKR